MTVKIFRSIMAAVGGVLIASLLVIFGFLYEYFGGVQKKQLENELELAAVGVERAGEGYLCSLETDSRLTWIAADGSVLYDDTADTDGMENHSDRPEIREAMTSGSGSSERYSDTLLTKNVYYAKRLTDGSVLRISISQASVAVLALGVLQPLCTVLLVALIFAFVLADRLSKRIVEPLNTLDLDHPTENDTYEELSPLLRRIDRLHGQIDSQLCTLRQKRDEFAKVTECMNEGLVLLDERGHVLSLNPSAKRLLHAGEFDIGKDILVIERSRELEEAIAEATHSGHAELELSRDGRMYQLDISRIESEGKTVGVVLLSFDTTERAEAERSRREFTANVSHELKTPLTAILGSSELLQAGLVKDEDIPRFAGHIHSEAARLLTLIEDIIRLSQLDEGGGLPTEEVELSEVVRDVVAQLSPKAAEHNVTIDVQAGPCVLSGVPRLFQEIVYNLTENAIKYNVDGGSVHIGVTGEGVLTVADTGVGIPSEHQGRVFERFYRVDKSHSRAIGGTGLGLSIVKHAAAHLGATVDLQSSVGRGTTVTVRFVAA